LIKVGSLRSAPEFATEQDVTGAFREIAEIWQARATAFNSDVFSLHLKRFQKEYSSF